MARRPELHHVSRPFSDRNYRHQAVCLVSPPGWEPGVKCFGRLTAERGLPRHRYIFLDERNIVLYLAAHRTGDVRPVRNEKKNSALNSPADHIWSSDRSFNPAERDRERSE
jgi:hypothetical protein